MNSYQIIRNQIKNWRVAKDGIKKIVWLGITSKWRSTPVQAAHAASSQLCSWFFFSVGFESWHPVLPSWWLMSAASKQHVSGGQFLFFFISPFPAKPGKNRRKHCCRSHCFGRQVMRISFFYIIIIIIINIIYNNRIGFWMDYQTKTNTLRKNLAIQNKNVVAVGPPLPYFICINYYSIVAHITRQLTAQVHPTGISMKILNSSIPLWPSPFSLK